MKEPSSEAVELLLCAQSNGRLYSQCVRVINVAMHRRLANGTYDKARAPLAYAFALETEAKNQSMNNTNPAPWHRQWPKSVRDEAAQLWAWEFEENNDL